MIDRTRWKEKQSRTTSLSDYVDSSVVLKSFASYKHFVERRNETRRSDELVVGFRLGDGVDRNHITSMTSFQKCCALARPLLNSAPQFWPSFLLSPLVSPSLAWSDLTSSRLPSFSALASCVSTVDCLTNNDRLSPT